MKSLCIVAVVFLCLISSQALYFRYPNPLKTTIYSNQPGQRSFMITWDPVKDWDDNNPIIGYKLAVWQMKELNYTSQTLVPGVLTEVKPLEGFLITKIPVADPTIYVLAPDERKVIINDVNLDVWYQFSAMAFTKKGEGPLSPPVGVKAAVTTKQQKPLTSNSTDVM